MQKLGDILSERALAHFAGREREVQTLLDYLAAGESIEPSETMMISFRPG